jgi:hypothetical protein
VTFMGNYLRFEIAYRSHLQETAYLLLKVEPMECTETSVYNYPSTLSNSPDELRIYLNHGRSCNTSLQVMFTHIKCTLLQALRLCTGRTAHRGSRGITLLFHDQRH